MEIMQNYYKFKPLLKTLIWGTESWQISGVPGNETPTVSDGSPVQTLNNLVKEQKDRLVGKANYERFGDEFPLLIKFIDAHQNLSIQVHPTDEIAHRQGKPRGKTEMWYVMDSAPDAMLYNGLKQQITPEEYKSMVEDDTICDALAQYNVKEGDCFFIPAGRIHAIGAGCYLAEIQQTSDVTYRIYDYGRRDKDGNLRELHTKEAAESIDYRVLPDYRQAYTPKKNEGQTLVECPYFNTAVYDLNEPMQIDYSELDSFVILIGLKGEGRLNIDGEEVSFGKGETILLPAYINNVRAEGTVKFLETFVG
ncbi:MAG: mannose-6-phosphate isomerase [Prevotella sp.]|jgi:mannose-6-phosphate isomerase|nr:mannose-6-phosphate isomerase [Prevotella sp.]